MLRFARAHYAAFDLIVDNLVYKIFQQREMKNSKPKTRHKQNLVDKAVQHLTREILADRLRPNQRISEVAVCDQLGISRSPVREALRMLERDGLVSRAASAASSWPTSRPRKPTSFIWCTAT